MSMTYKNVRIERSGETDGSDLEAINKFTLSPLNKDEVFTFKVAMCDNAIDRDFERFSDASLYKMAELFVGKTVVKDHDHKSDNQVARIYAADVVDGADGFKQLVAKCYMIKTKSTENLIAEIKGGIKKEVSVGVAVSSAICSICGKDNVKEYCKHLHGREYDGSVCYFTLDGVTDAYELSFVAIPAQRLAGTTKSYIAKEEPVDDEKKPEDEKPIDEPDTEDAPEDETPDGDAPEEAPEGDDPEGESPEEAPEDDPESDSPDEENDPKPDDEDKASCDPEDEEKDEDATKRLRLNRAWMFSKRKEIR